jgi:hypothetical protein
LKKRTSFFFAVVFIVSSSSRRTCHITVTVSFLPLLFFLCLPIFTPTHAPRQTDWLTDGAAHVSDKPLLYFFFFFCSLLWFFSKCSHSCCVELPYAHTQTKKSKENSSHAVQALPHHSWLLSLLRHRHPCGCGCCGEAGGVLREGSPPFADATRPHRCSAQ